MTNKTIEQLYAEHRGKVSDKWSIYLSEYDRLFLNYRDLPVRLLEIGIQNGGSLEIWSKFFPYAEKIVGCDINPDCARLKYEDSRIAVVVADANTDEAQRQILGYSPSFDLIIDDGSHQSRDIISSFARYFAHLNDGGLYVIEDIHCSYWQEFEGGVFQPYSSISFFKRLVDVVNHEHWGIEKTRCEILSSFTRKYGVNFDEALLCHIHSVEFINSICVIRKAKPMSNVLGRRVIAGTIESVILGHLPLHGSSSPQPNQMANEWAARNVPVEEELMVRLQEIASLNQVVAERDAQISSLKEAVAERDGIIHQIFASTSWRFTRLLRSVKAFFTSKFNSLNPQKNQPKHFNAKWYLKQNPDVAMSGMDPYAHYILYGKKEGRQPAPDPLLQRKIKRVRLIHTVLAITIRRSGGIRPVTRKALAVLKREGWSGLKQRLIFLHAQATHTAGQSEGFDCNDYTEWIRRYDTLTDETRAAMRARIDAFEHNPLISVIMPTYNPKPDWLEQAIESVRNQIYPNWELCIADDASTDKAIRPILERYAKEDARIKVVFREQNGHISAASNSALELAAGEWVALLDHDDLLAEHALFWVADAINQHPEARLIYSDEDKIDEAGRRFDPYFKCDWNEDLFYSHNMFSHLGVYHTRLLREIGGFRIGLEGAQDYDLALRCIERVAPQQIYHIPRVLYHWRVHSESTAQSSDAKPYAILAGERALNEHFQRLGVNAKALHVGYGYRVYYALPDNPPMVSLIIPTRNGLHLVRQCVKSIFEKTTYPNYEILIVDNGSDDPAILHYFKELQSEARVRIIRDDRPFNYSALNNAAVKLARGEVVGLLNNDIEVISPDWLSEMVSHAMRPEVGAVGARLWYPNGTLQHGGIVLGLAGVASHSHKHFPREILGYFGRASLIQSFSAVTAACLVIRKSVYKEVGGFNETDLQVAFNDVDFCLRIREAGYRNVWTPYAELYHHESATRGYEDTPEKQARFAKEVQYMKQRWGDLLLNDPAYNPNLTLDHEDFSLAWPPRVELVTPPATRA